MKRFNDSRCHDLFRAHPRQIFHRPIGLVVLQFLQFRAAGGHGQDFCADELSAAHVKRRVADDHDFLRLQMRIKHPAAAGQRGDRA